MLISPRLTLRINMQTIDDKESTAGEIENYPFLHRDISWLSFNYRVLQEAKDPTVPLLERLKFLAIYSSNLDEFFRVRVANHRNLMRAGKKTRQVFDYNPKAILKQILHIVNEQQQEVSKIFEKQIVPELGKYRIFLKRRLQLGEKQRHFVENYFDEYMLPYVQPVLLLKGKIRPFLNNASLYLVVHMEDKEDHSTQYAIVKVPSDHLPRFIQLPSLNGRREIIMLDDIVRHSVSDMFPGYDILDTYSIKLTRDAELYIDDEYSGDLLGKIRDSLTKRHVGPPSRFVYDREMPLELLDFLVDTFELKRSDLLVEGRYHNNFDFIKFPDFGLKQLKNKPLPPLKFKPLEAASEFFTALRAKDYLLAFPYHSYQSVIDFFEKASQDPLVKEIKITQYRVAKESRIMNALMEAVENGKKVFVFIEVKARFDEEANLNWGEKLQAAGVKVAYSIPGMKVHSKLAQVIRQEPEGLKTYTYLSTGNFHEGTATIYGDFGIFTTDVRLTEEVSRLFNFLATGKRPKHNFEHLLVGQFQMREKIEWLIDREIANAKAGKPCGISLKLNSIQDEKMIIKLYQASQAGVPVKLIIRGICSVMPGVPGISENIQIISIVDRYLEHARVFMFHNEGNEDIYLASADLMTRNLKWRIETVFPVYDEAIKQQIQDVIAIQWKDNKKARIIDHDRRNEYRKTPGKGVQSQVETYNYFKKLQG